MPPVPQTKAAPASAESAICHRAPLQPVLRSSAPTLFTLAALLLAFLALQSLLPLATALKIGADEDFELSKAVLLNHGHKLFTEIWSDQPPLYTFTLAKLLQHVSHSILPPRLLTVGFAAVLLSSVFFLVRRTNGLLPAALATGFLIGSPGFLELSSSSMQEIPALAPVIASRRKPPRAFIGWDVGIAGTDITCDTCDWHRVYAQQIVLGFWQAGFSVEDAMANWDEYLIDKEYMPGKTYSEINPNQPDPWYPTRAMGMNSPVQTWKISGCRDLTRYDAIP